VGKGRKGAGLKHHQRNHLAQFAATGGIAFVYYLEESSGHRFIFRVSANGDLGQGLRKSVPLENGQCLDDADFFYDGVLEYD